MLMLVNDGGTCELKVYVWFSSDLSSLSIRISTKALSAGAHCTIASALNTPAVSGMVRWRGDERGRDGSRIGGAGVAATCPRHRAPSLCLDLSSLDLQYILAVGKYIVAPFWIPLRLGPAVIVSTVVIVLPRTGAVAAGSGAGVVVPMVGGVSVLLVCGVSGCGSGSGEVVVEEMAEVDGIVVVGGSVVLVASGVEVDVDVEVELELEIVLIFVLVDVLVRLLVEVEVVVLVDVDVVESARTTSSAWAAGAGTPSAAAAAAASIKRPRRIASEQALSKW